MLIPYRLPPSAQLCPYCRARNDTLLMRATSALQFFPAIDSQNNQVGFYPLFMIARADRVPPPTVPAQTTSPTR